MAAIRMMMSSVVISFFLGGLIFCTGSIILNFFGKNGQTHKEITFIVIGSPECGL